MRIKLLLSIFIVFFSIDAFTQSMTWDDYNRYWYYRYRLVKKFLVRGEENPLVSHSATGYSIPASQVFSYDADTGQKVALAWGDATSYLGWYIAVLATEYKLLNDNGQSTDATKQELYYAMKAYERLDRKAESNFYPYTGTNTSADYLNGLFTRDDVSEDFLKTQTDFVKQFTLVDPGTPFHIHSDQHKYQDVNHQDINDQNSNIYPTTDQMADLFMGFALVKKFLGNETYQGYNFVNNAKLYTSVIMSKVEGDGWNLKLGDGNHYENSDFRFLPSNYGLARAAFAITGNQNFLNTTEMIGFKSTWDTFSDPLLGAGVMAAEKVWNRQYIQTLAAIGQSWEYGIAPTAHYSLWDQWVCYTFDVNIPGLPAPPVPICGPAAITPKPGTLTYNVTANFLDEYGATYNQEIFVLLNQVLNNDGSALPNAEFTSMIVTAPCDGPMNKPTYNSTLISTNGWKSVNRFERPDDPDIAGEYNGLDYMLLYNLYRIARGSNVSYKNMLNINSNDDLVSSGKYWSYETMNLSGTVPNNASTSSGLVEINSNNSVVLEPGFNIVRGANARVYVANNTACNTSEGQSGALRKTFDDVQVVSPEEIKQQVRAQMVKGIQAKLDSIYALYQHLTVDSATAVKQYLEENNPANKCVVFPNPTFDIVYVQLILKQNQKVRIIASDLYGSSIETLFDDYVGAGANRINLSIKDFRAGVLTLEIKCDEVNVIKKLIKRDSE